MNAIEVKEFFLITSEARFWIFFSHCEGCRADAWRTEKLSNNSELLTLYHPRVNATSFRQIRIGPGLGLSFKFGSGWALNSSSRVVFWAFDFWSGSGWVELPKNPGPLTSTVYPILEIIFSRKVRLSARMGSIGWLVPEIWLRMFHIF